MIKDTVASILNTVKNIFMSIYGSVEEVVTMCLVYKIWRLLCSYSHPLRPPPNPTKKKSLIWILCHYSLSRELKIRFVGFFTGLHRVSKKSGPFLNLV